MQEGFVGFKLCGCIPKEHPPWLVHLALRVECTLFKVFEDFLFVRYLLCDTFALPKFLCTATQTEQQMASQSIQALVALLCACFSHEP